MKLEPLALFVVTGCGNVASNPELDALEDRLAVLEAQVGTLSVQIDPFAELTCADGQTLSWNGSRWSCVNGYSDVAAVAAVAATDAYVTKLGDSTITGNLTVSGTTATDQLDIASGMARFGDSEMKFFRASLLRSGTTIQLADAEGAVLSELDLGDGLQNLQSSRIAYRAGVAGSSDAKLLFNIDESPTLRCTLLHHDDDTPQPGLYFATDSGNTSLATSVWGNATTGTFVLSRQSIATHVIANSSRYQIVCF